MNKKDFKRYRRLPWLTLGLFGLPFVGDFMISGEAFTPKAAAFTTPVSNQTITDEIVAGGIQEINSGGIANNTIINSGGVQNVNDDGLVNNTTINAGGVQNITDAGRANNTIINDGGYQYLYNGASADRGIINTGGVIYIAGDNTYLGSTALNGGELRVLPASRDGSSFRALQFKSLDGYGDMYLNTNLEAGIGDRVYILLGGEGNYQLFFNNQGGARVDPTRTLTVIFNETGDADFALGNQLEAGGYLYDLRKKTDALNDWEKNNWELYSTGRSTSTANASIQAFAGGYLLNYAETQSLLQRMGDLRHGEDQSGVWARVFGGKFDENGSSFLSGFDMNYSGMQAGVDRKLSFKGKGDLYVGGMFGYSKGNLAYQTGHGSIDSKTLGVYGTYIAPSGFYADLVLKYGWMKNDFKVLDTAGALVTGENMSTDGLSASIEVGQKIHFNKTTEDGWYVEPQAQISMGHQSGGYFNASNGLRVDVDSYNSTLGRLGVNVGYEVKSGKNPINVYAKASYVHEFDGDVGYRLNGSAEQTSFGDSWWTYGVGITAQLNKKHNVYLDIERASGGKFNQPWSINGGYRFSW